MGARNAVALGLVVAMISIGGIIWAVPSVDDFSLENPYWNGLSSAAAELSISKAEGALDQETTALLIMGPETGFDPERVSAIRGYLESGGMVVFMDEFGGGQRE